MALDELPPSAQAMYKTWWSTVMAWAAEVNPATGGRYGASDISVLASASRQLYPGVYPSYSPPGVSALYTRALAITNSAGVLAAADPAGPVPDTAVALAPWSADQATREAMPAWQARVEATYVTAEGVQEAGTWTLPFKGVLPSSVASLTAQAELRVTDYLMAPPGTGTPRKGELSSVDSITLLAVLDAYLH